MTDQKKTAREELQEQIDELRKRLEALENEEWLADNPAPKPKRGKRAKGGEG